MVGLPIAVDAHGTDRINDALRAGVDTIEHAGLAEKKSFRLAKVPGVWFELGIHKDDYTPSGFVTRPVR